MRIYKGRSRLSGFVRAIATGLDRQSTNKKTGPMVQIWFLPTGNIPEAVWINGRDKSVCGNCPMRAFDSSGNRQKRRCYVNVAKAPSTVGKADDRGRYPEFDLSAFHGKNVRFGAYGEPVSVPFRILRKIAEIAKGWTGYTHQWRIRKNRKFAQLVMASVESVADKKRANRLGFRTFRVLSPDDTLEPDEILCPASKEAGERVQCSKCMLCSGTRFGKLRNARNVAIHEHK